MTRRAAASVAVLGALVGTAALPAAAAAHGIVGRRDLPIPETAFVWAAAAVLIVSFVGLALLWPTPRLQKVVERPLFTLPAWVDPLCGVLGVALFGIVVYAGFTGTQTPTANLAPTFVYVLFWVGLVPLSLLFGNIFGPFNPWLAIGRFSGWTSRRVAGDGLPEPLPYPRRLGRWPALAGLVAFGWLELAASGGDDPSTLSALALAYAAVQLVGMSLYGVGDWSERGDAFGTYFGIIGRLSPIAREGREVVTRRPLSAVTTLPLYAGTVTLLCAMIGITLFDGFQQGSAWTGLAPDLQRLFTDLGLGTVRAIELSSTVGLFAAIGFVVLVYRLGILGMRSVGGPYSADELARRFAHTLVPIAVAYAVAHYFSLLAYQGQAVGYLASNPLGDVLPEGDGGLFGTASWQIDYGVVDATQIWYVQVAALVVGHVAALILAHDRALATFSRVREATRSQYWMLTVMVGFTCLGLWVLSATN